MSARTIIEEDGVSTALDAVTVKYSRFEDIWDAWTWRLCRGPEIDAVPIPGSDPVAYLIKMPDLSVYDFPLDITILYSFSEDLLTIINIRVVESANED
jgi:hypothetical protein